MTDDNKNKEKLSKETADEKYVRLALLYLGASSYEDFEDFAEAFPGSGESESFPTLKGGAEHEPKQDHRKGENVGDASPTHVRDHCNPHGDGGQNRGAQSEGSQVH